MFTKLDDLFKQSTPKKKKLVLAVGQDENSLEAAYTAHHKGVIELILYW
jgi:phosphotransacetylase